MAYRVLADLTVATHFAYVAFVILAVPMILVGRVLRWNWIRNRWFRSLHLAMISIVVFEAWAGITCPLTTLENEFRSAAGDETYSGGFIATWMHDVMFFDAPAWVFIAAYSAFGALVLSTFLLVPPQWRRQPPQSDSVYNA